MFHFYKEPWEGFCEKESSALLSQKVRVCYKNSFILFSFFFEFVNRFENRT